MEEKDQKKVILVLKDKILNARGPADILRLIAALKNNKDILTTYQWAVLNRKEELFCDLFNIGKKILEFKRGNINPDISQKEADLKNAKQIYALFLQLHKKRKKIDLYYDPTFDGKLDDFYESLSKLSKDIKLSEYMQVKEIIVAKAQEIEKTALDREKILMAKQLEAMLIEDEKKGESILDKNMTRRSALGVIGAGILAAAGLLSGKEAYAEESKLNNNECVTLNVRTYDELHQIINDKPKSIVYYYSVKADKKLNFKFIDSDGIEKEQLTNTNGMADYFIRVLKKRFEKDVQYYKINLDEFSREEVMNVINKDIGKGLVPSIIAYKYGKVIGRVRGPPPNPDKIEEEIKELMF